MEMMLLLANNKGRGEGEGMLAGSEREGKAGGENEDFKCRDYEW